jgi:hypothetical protein
MQRAELFREFEKKYEKFLKKFYPPVQRNFQKKTPLTPLRLENFEKIPTPFEAPTS